MSGVSWSTFGFTFDGGETPDAEGVTWTLSDKSTGWYSGAGVRAEDLPRKTRDGDHPAAIVTRAARIITISTIGEAPNRDAMLRAWARLNAIPAGTPSLFTANDGLGLWANVVLRDGVLIEDLSDVKFRALIVLKATDPRKFGQSLTVATGLPSSIGGLTLPATLPTPINATTVRGQVSAINAGTKTGPVSIRVDGPCADFTITHVGASGMRVFAMNLPLAAGEFVAIDMEARTVLAQGQSSRTVWVTSRGWSGFEPGLNTWSFASSSASAAQMTITATPAWE